MVRVLLVVRVVARVVSATVNATEDELETVPEKAPFEELPMLALVAVAIETTFADSEALDDELIWIVVEGSAA